MIRCEPMRVLGELRLTEYEACDICQATAANHCLVSAEYEFSYCEGCAWLVEEYGELAVSSLFSGAPDRRAYFTQNLEWMRQVPVDLSNLEANE